MIQSYFERLPIEMKEYIFKYLKPSDLLNLTLVCRYFNESIGNSRCMSRFWIKFYTFKMKDLDSLHSSIRCYEKLKVNRVKKDDHFQFVISLQQKWRKILIYNCEFKHFSMYKSLIDSIASDVEELEISDIEILSYDEPVTSVKFPSLKRVMFRNMPSRAMEVFLSPCDHLENLAFDIPQEIEGSLTLHDITYQILRNSKNLKHLQLGPLYIKALFGNEHERHRFDFQLQHLLLKFPIASDLPDYSNSQIAEFIKSQSSINWFIAMELRNDQILTAAWNELNLAEQISFFGLEELFDVDLEFNVSQINTSVRKLSLLSRKVLISHLNKLLKSSPLLKSIHVRTLNRHMINSIVKNHKGIRIIFYEHIEEDVNDFYKQLINTAADINKEIQLIQRSFWFHNNPFSIDPVFWRKE